MNFRRMIGAFLVLSVACLTACASRSAPADPPHVSPRNPAACFGVCVTLTDNEIESSRVTFTVGDTSYFVVTNKGKAPTNFIIMTEPQGPNLQETMATTTARNGETTLRETRAIEDFHEGERKARHED